MAATPSPNPRRGVNGLDTSRVAMLLAVTERAAGIVLDRDVFVATVGGARLSDPATDLAVCLAVASAASGVAMPADVAVIGEVALSGDVRPVGHLAQRVSEAARLGYRRILVPPGSLKRLPSVAGGSAGGRARAPGARPGGAALVLPDRPEALTDTPLHAWSRPAP